jgi:hypothetical protein
VVASLVSALAIAFLPAIVASALVSRLDLSALRHTRRGRYVLANMPPTAQAVRMRLVRSSPDWPPMSGGHSEGGF